MFQYKLAIIIPSWNCSKYVCDMLDSIIANTFRDWKCFVIDDQSTDNSLDILKVYHDKDSRIIYKIRDREPKGAQTCRNMGFELSEGAEYVIWFDADDIIAPYCFEQRVAYMDRHPELDFGIFPAKTFKDDIWEVNNSTNFYGYKYIDDTLKAMLSRILPMVGWTNIYRRDSVVKCNLVWDTNILSLQDSDWNIQAILNGCKFDFAERENARIDYFYRIGVGGISSGIKSIKHGCSHLYYLDKLRKSVQQHNSSKYNTDLKAYSLWIEKKIKDDMNLFMKFMINKWFLRHPWLGVRILILHHFGSKYEDKLFPHIYKSEEENKKKYTDFIKVVKNNTSVKN